MHNNKNDDHVLWSSSQTPFQRAIFHRFFRSNQSQLSWQPGSTRIVLFFPRFSLVACLWFCIRNSFRARTGNINAGKLMYSVNAKFQRGKTYKRRKALESQNYNFFGFSTWFLSWKEVKPCDWFILHVTRLSRIFFFEQQYWNLKDRWQTVLSNTCKLPGANCLEVERNNCVSFTLLDHRRIFSEYVRHTCVSFPAMLL